MTYRTILIHLADDEQARTRLELAKGLAARFDAALTVLHVTLPPFIPASLGEGAAYAGPEIYEAQRVAAAEVTERMKALYRDVCEPLTVPASWRHEQGDPGTVVARLARTVDLTVLVQDTQGGPDLLGPSVLEQAALTAGGPVLMVPSGWSGSTVGQRVVVGWNGGREAARALKDALPFLAAAEGVALATFGEIPGVDDLVAMLDRHGVRAEPARREESPDVGGALLGLAAARRADLLVMGAYGHSRLREIVLGGATRGVLAEASLPVLLSC
ncbi:MAG TPA: universal stress protein [Geminicoccaceae bacterium]|nr:universal stress protein [Geminicoccaceae bacterium]